MFSLSSRFSHYLPFMGREDHEYSIFQFCVFVLKFKDAKGSLDVVDSIAFDLSPVAGYTSCVSAHNSRAKIIPV